MVKWAIRYSTTAGRLRAREIKRWQFVSFVGPQAAESRGIVDLVAIRRDHKSNSGVFRPGDLFEMVLIQIKGGDSAWPTLSDLKRLRAVSRRYGAKAVVLASWRRASSLDFYTLSSASNDRRRAWRQVDPRSVFA